MQDQAIKQARYLQKRLRETRSKLHERTLEALKHTPIDKRFGVTPICLTVFDDLDRIVRDVLSAIDRIETPDAFVERISKMCKEELLTSDEVCIQRLAKNIYSQHNGD